MRAIPLFVPRPSFMFEEAGINMANTSMPHGYIDVLLLSGNKADKHHMGFLVVGKNEVVVHTANSVKTESSFGTAASG